MHAVVKETQTLATEREMLAPGTTLAGRYRIERVSGAGGMGVVYCARDLQLNVDVALKLLHPDGHDTEDSLARLRREVLLTRRVSHPNVVRLHDIGRDGALTFITMDHIAAPTLRDRLADGPLGVQRSLRIAHQVALGLGAAHAQGIVHRDLKPANVLVDDDNRAWLADFGIARGGGDGTTTRAEALVGTLDYLAPEQVRGDPVTSQADIYAFGLMLWEMLTTEIPMTGATREETLARRAAGRLPARLPRGDTIPKSVESVVRRCLADDPADRYPTIEAAAADLALGKQSSGVARRIGTVGVVAGLAAAAVFGWTWFVTPQGEPEPTVVQAEPARRLAVLPFVNATGDPGFGWVQRVLAEQISIALAANPTVEAVDSVRVFRSLADLRLQADDLDQRSLGEMFELFNASALVRGHVIGSGDGMRLQVAMLVRGETDYRYFERPVTPATLLDGAERISASLLDALNVQRDPQDSVTNLSAHPAALASFDDGVGRLARGERAGAVIALEEAVSVDPEFGMAWLRLSDAYVAAGAYDRGVDAAQRAWALLEPIGGRYALWARARHAALSGDHANAITVLAGLTRRFPQDTYAQVAYGEALAAAGRFPEAIGRLRAVVETDPQHPRAWFLLGKFAIQSGDPRRAAEDWLVRALVVQNRFGTDEGRGEVVNALGIANEHLGSLDIAAAHYREAARLRAAAGDRRGEAGSLANLARAMMIRGERSLAREHLARALHIRDEIGDLPGIANLRNEFGVLEEEIGDYRTALTHYREALRLRTELGDTQGITESHANLAFTYFLLGEYENADAFASRAVASAEEPLMPMLTQGQLGIVRGDWVAAQNAILRTIERSRETDNPYAQAAAEGLIGEMSRLQGRFGPALQAFDRALDIVTTLGDTRGQVEFHLQRAALWLDMEQTDAAAQDLDAAMAAGGGSIAQRAMHARLVGIVAARRGDDGEARAAYDRAVALATESGSAAESAATALARIRWLPTSRAEIENVVAQAAQLGHRTLRLDAMSRLAEHQSASGEHEAAAHTVRDALSPPLGLALWAGNWRLYALAGEHSRSRSSFDARWSGVPDKFRHGWDDAVANP
ncbi:MAG: protein kinase [Gammaproteobacteria bacterium]